ncbi:MAG TPA: efflux transporter outer membrane subunit [Pirellulales bacterium]|nr:efflux transporter outer membrane subunit [Pirellulales bacterium]
MLSFLRRWTTPAAAFMVLLSGCTSFRDYIHNGFKVGPNYKRPPALVAEHWIDESDKRVRSQCDDLSAWWTVLNDPLLNQLMVNAYQQDLTLREAGFRVLEARAQLAIARGEFFPQSQTANGSYTRFGVGQNFFSSWNFNFNLNWELDFWGRFRRAIIAADETLDASVYNYDDALVTLLGDVATDYVQVRTDQERIRLLDNTVKVQENVLTFIDTQLKSGFHGITDLDHAQALSNLKQSQAQIAQLQIDMRSNENALCTLLGIPTVDIEPLLNSAPKRNIPVTPETIVVGVPADLLRRRPDVRAAERNAASQAEQIGIAEADLYPAFTINGTLGWQAARLGNLFTPQAFNSNVGPSFQWNVLNYGRLVNNVRLQDATLRELVATYQQTVLSADEEVEDGIVTFLKSQERAKLLRDSVDAAYLALEVVIAQYENPTTIAGAGADFNRYAVILQNLIQQQDLWAQSRGQIALGLIETYRALGGGWQIRCAPTVAGVDTTSQPSDAPPVPPEQILTPPQELPAMPLNPTEGAPAVTPSAPSVPLPPTPTSPPPATAPMSPATSNLPSSTAPTTAIPTPAPANMPKSSTPATAPMSPAPRTVPANPRPTTTPPAIPLTLPSTSQSDAPLTLPATAPTSTPLRLPSATTLPSSAPLLSPLPPTDANPSLSAPNSK